MSAPKSIKLAGIGNFRSRSAAALKILQKVAAGKSNWTKVQIAKKVGMTPQTVHAVQRANNLNIDFRAMQKANTASGIPLVKIQKSDTKTNASKPAAKSDNMKTKKAVKKLAPSTEKVTA